MITKEFCQSEALKYRTRSEFQKYSCSAYNKALKEGWIDDICQHIPKSRILDYEFCKEVVSGYDSLQLFRKNDIQVYNKIRNNQWLELLEHLKDSHIPKDRLIYVYEFSDLSVYVGLTCEPKQRSKRHSVDMDSSVCQYILESSLTPIYKELTDFMDENIASILEGEYENIYKDMGYKILNKVKTGTLGGKCIRLTYEYCNDIASKYTSFYDFRLENLSIYNKAVKLNWLDIICSHMVRKPKKIKWTKELCQIEASRYNRKIDFKTYSNMAYRNAIKNKWMDEIWKNRNL